MTVCSACKSDQSRYSGPPSIVCFVCGASLPGAPAVGPGLELGACRLERKLGQGGMGQAWRAHHRGLDCPVVVKLMLPGHHGHGAHERFIQEARLTARLRHPNVVQVFDVAEAHGLHYIVMELCPGGSARDELARGPLTEARAVHLMRGVAEALGYAASQSIVHRDVKPDNILIGVHGEAKLADLGLARRVTPERPDLTAAGARLGTPHYMAPEQAQDAHRADARSDLYGLGATIYHLACGHPPFGGTNALEVAAQHATAPVPDVRARAPHLSPAFAAVLARCMRKDPKERYQSAAELVRALAPPDPELGEAMELMRQLKKRKGKL